MGIRLPSALLLDSGGGWFDADKATAGILNEPLFSLKYLNDNIKVLSSKGDKNYSDNPLLVLEDFIAKGYIGIGYIGYNFLESTNKGFKSKFKKEGIKYPQMFFNFYKQSDLIKVPYTELSKYIGTETTVDKYVPEIFSNLSESDYIDKVKSIKDYIASGDIYQVNLSQRFYSSSILKPLPYFLKLFEVQPVPYSIYIDFNDFQFLSGSMELYLEKNGKKIITKPIKGTTQRGKNEKEDEQLKNELQSSFKERAENVMIVDLMRNDLGRICEYGSVRVNKLFEINSYETLFQMESQISGTLRSGIKLSDIIYNTFPPGSVTGAPKRRALEIIDELEPHFRGPYCGAVCMFLPNGDFKMSVAIRIMLNNINKSVFWVGSGIVWDSDPESEYNETLLKASAIIKAIEN